MALPVLPRAQAAIAGTSPPTAHWYDFFRELRAFVADNEGTAEQLAAIDARIAALEAGEDAKIQGRASVRVFGSLSNGLVQITLDGDQYQPGARYVYGTDAAGVKTWTPVLVENLDGATYSTLQHYVNTMTSPGIITGCDLSRLDVDTVQVSAGTGMIRVADDDVSSLVFFDIPAGTFDIPADQETRFYGVVYSAGAVAYEARLVDDWDKDTEIPLGSAVRFNGTMVVTPNKYRTGDPITNVIQRFYADFPASRDNSLGGLALGETGTRNVTVSAGRIWSRLSDFDVASKDSSADAMVSVYFNGTNLTFTSGLSQWDNLQYNDMGTGALVTMGNNKYANLWFFVSIDGTQYGFAYGTGQYNTLGEAADEGVPAYLNQDFFNQSLLLGRFLFQKSAATAARIESAFIAAFSSAAINDHNSLGGLQGGTVGEFYHLTSAEHTKVQALPAASEPAGSAAVALAAANTYTDDEIADLALVYEPIIAPGTTAQFYRGDKAWTNELLGALLITGQSGALPGLDLTRYTNDTAPASVRSFKARGTIATPAAITTADTLVFIQGRGYFATGGTPTAFSGNVGALELQAVEAFTNTAQGTKWVFSTVAAGTTTRADRLSLDSTALFPVTTNALTSGTATQRWLSVYASGINLGGVLTPPEITSNQNDYAPTGHATAYHFRLDTDASRTITSLAGGVDGREILITNIGTTDLVLEHASASGTAANRFLCPGSANLTLNPNDSVRLRYDGTSARWRALGF